MFSGQEDNLPKETMYSKNLRHRKVERELRNSEKKPSTIHGQVSQYGPNIKVGLVVERAFQGGRDGYKAETPSHLSVQDQLCGGLPFHIN